MHTKTPRHKHTFGNRDYCSVCGLSKDDVRERAEAARKAAAKATAERQRKIAAMREKGMWPGLDMDKVAATVTLLADGSLEDGQSSTEPPRSEFGF